MDQETIYEILQVIRDFSLSKEEKTRYLSQYHESDIAMAVQELTDEEKKVFFSTLTIDELAELFPFLDSPEEYIEQMPTEAAADIIENMDADDAVDLLEEVDEDKVEDILQEMNKESREDVNLIRRYSDEEIGSKITTNFISVKIGSSIKEAMRVLVSEAPENDNISNLFVVDKNNKYYGTIVLKDLIIARADSKLEDITRTSYPTLYANDMVSDVINEIKDIDLEIIPVLSDEDEILGVITSSDIIETVGDELGEDYAKFAGLTEATDVEEPFLKSVKKRIPWLSLLLCMDIITSTVLNNFSWIFATMPALVLFQSLVLDCGGNAGTQSLAVTIRALSDHELKKGMIFKRTIKELLIGLVDGLFAGVVSFIVVFLFLLATKNTVTSSGNIGTQLLAAMTVGVSLAFAIPLATMAGMLFPLIFDRIHIDPAVASGPLITTLSDVCGVTIYYSLAILVFQLIS